MGFDVHTLNFMLATKKWGPFGKTVTIGRQNLNVPESFLRKALSLGPDYKNEVYVDQLLLKFFGSDKVDSIDLSGFEEASIVHDMNIALPSTHQGLYGTVIDSGCLEHIYHAPQALQNCSLLAKPGGQILHILPANNFCGHGFWQFSPELFFSIYSDSNGYRDTEVFLADLAIEDTWFKVKPPANGQRVTVHSGTPLYALVRTVKKGLDFSHSQVQQSDYVHEWASRPAGMPGENRPKPPSRIKHFLKKSKLIYALMSPFYQVYLRLNSPAHLNAKNPGLTEMKVSSLI